MIAAIYARKSTDQSAVADEAKSVTRQVLKELARAGVRVFGYQNDRAISLETPSDTLFTTVNAWKDSEARRESSVCVHDALGRKARVGHVTGGRVFGYRNRDVFEETDAHGRPRRSQVRREIHEAEAAVVRRIFELCAAGIGVKGTATFLNDAGAVSFRKAPVKIASLSSFVITLCSF